MRNALKVRIDPRIEQTEKRKGAKYMPLKLKSVLAQNNISQSEWSAALQPNGRPMSRSAANRLVNWGQWPKTTPASFFREKTEKFLISRGVPEEQLKNLWQIDVDDGARNVDLPGRSSYETRVNSLTKRIIHELPEAEMLTQTAKKHFQLFRDPFVDDVQNVDDVFVSKEQHYIREAMFHTAKHGGFLAVIGESGAGKTTLRRDLIERVHREALTISVIQPRIIDKTRLTAGAICDAIVNDISKERPRRTLEAKARQVEKLLTGSSRAGNTHVLMIEEAHDLTVQALKYLKRFWELEDGFRKLLSIILIGQPELKDMLDERQNWGAREVIRRCEIAELLPLDEDVHGYLATKFKRLNRSVDDIFERDAFDAIRDRLTIQVRGNAGGVSMCYPLVVNNCVTKAMNIAADIGATKISADIIAEV